MADLHFLNGRTSTIAPLLLGCILERQINGYRIRVKIVETEAYDEYTKKSYRFYY